MTSTFSALVPQRRNPTDQFHTGASTLPFSVGDFWCWAASDLVSNTLRGLLAEFLVARGLDLERTVRTEWDAFDLRVPGGPTIEVKSSAFVQTWSQRRLSRPCFSIRPTSAWSDDAGAFAPPAERRRQADIYVFALLHHRDKATLDPTDVDQWTFHVLRSAVLDDKMGTQGTLSLSALKRLDPLTCHYNELANAVESLAHED